MTPRELDAARSIISPGTSCPACHVLFVMDHIDREDTVYNEAWEMLALAHMKDQHLVMFQTAQVLESAWRGCGFVPARRR